jgi:hypothetical protein
MRFSDSWVFATVAGAVTALGMFGVLGDVLDGKGTPITGDYVIYSGALGDSGLPTPKEAKASIRFSGKLASDLYRNLGPAADRESCDPADKERSRGDLDCVLRGGKGPAECWIGLNIKTGRSIGGVIC